MQIYTHHTYYQILHFRECSFIIFKGCQCVPKYRSQGVQCDILKPPLELKLDHFIDDEETMDEFDSCDSSDEDYEPFDEQSCDDDSDHELVIFDLHLAYYRSVNAI